MQIDHEGTKKNQKLNHGFHGFSRIKKLKDLPQRATERKIRIDR